MKGYNKTFRSLSLKNAPSDSFGFLYLSDGGGGSAPTNNTPPSISGTAIVGQTLTVTAGSWSGSPTPTLSYQWYRGATPISGETNTTYTLVAADAGEDIKCFETGANTHGSATADSNTLSVFLTMLDKYPMYNGWSVARLLKGSYYGSPIIRLRRSSDNNEQDFGVTTSGLLDEAAITTWAGANSAYIVTVYAQDESSRHFAQSTPSNQPLFVNAGTITKRTGAGTGAVAHPAMDYNGSRYLEVASSKALFNFIHNGSNAYVLGVIEYGKTSDPNAIYAMIGNSSSGSQNGVFITYEDRVSNNSNNASQIAIYRGSGLAVYTINQNTITPQQVGVHSLRLDADNATAADRCKLFIDNGVELKGNTQTATPSASDATYNLQWGAIGNGTLKLVGYASELYIDNTDRNATDASIRADINSFYKTY